MALRKRSGKWHYRFQYKGQEYTGSTDLAATSQNMREANGIEAEALKALKSGRSVSLRGRPFFPLAFEDG
jgi:hypothetical protein